MKALNTKIAAERFSLNARHYDDYAFIQRRVAAELAAKISAQGRDYRYILDIGTGTGALVKELELSYPAAKIFALDIAWGMLSEAKHKCKARLIQADAAMPPFLPEKFDLIASNLTYQWLPDLGQAFAGSNLSLAQGGDFYFSLFARGTLRELIACVSKITKTEPLAFLPSKDIIYAALKQAGFRSVEIVIEAEEEFFTGAWELLRWLKALGVNYRGITFKGLLTRRIIEKIDNLYRDNFRHNGKIVATFEKVLVKAH